MTEKSYPLVPLQDKITKDHEKYKSRSVFVDEILLWAEKTLAQDWLRPEEDEAWKNLE